MPEYLAPARMEADMRVLKMVDQYLEEVIVVILLAGMTFLVGLQVIMRYVMQDSLSWSEELARYLFIWMVNIGISYGVKKKRHISIDAINLFLTEKKAAYLSVLADVLFLTFAVIIVRYGAEVVQRIGITGQTTPALEISMQLVYCALPVGFTLVCFRLLQSIYKKVKLIQQGNFGEIEKAAG
ncbi:TRAP transporter small permease [Oceanidesulfovibrio marinus]|uniref:TRAP transporter small permease n=1 Tax=Oceanidesulfovibrio marinus TaxID=370038 RepID=A0ABX6NKZ6_9BACT|nr:TRAP transporter small permease [Oceanidesulfovibrio marinus]QJT10295.1 TRAP transporter small permease [Oceanidesulfovibrio marinus]